MRAPKWIAVILLLNMAGMTGNVMADRGRHDGRGHGGDWGSHHRHSGLGPLGAFLGVVGTIAVIDAIASSSRPPVPPRPYYPPYAPSYYQPALVIERPSPVYIERLADGFNSRQSSPAGIPAPPTAPSAAASGYWYFCAESRTYYPYAKECPGGWEKVLPAPPDRR